MYEYSTYKLKIGKYGKYVSLIGKNNEKIVNIGIDKDLQNKLTIYNLNQEVLDKLIETHINKQKNININKDILKILSETEIETEEKEEIKIKFLYNQV